MKLFGMLSVLSIIILLLTGCEDISKREYVDIQYLNDEQENYPNDDIGDETNNNLVETSQDKYIKWTATVTEVKSDKRLTLKEEGLPKISKT